MSVKALQDYTFTSKYARYLPEEKRRETWGEAIDRVRDMHIRRYPQIEEEIRWAFEQSRQKRVLGSQRALQFGGPAIEKKNARIYNCISSYCDRLRFFQECFWLLLCGCGTGFSVQKHHVNKLPKFSDKLRFNKPKVFQIPDTIEGWADSVGVLLSSYFGGGDFSEYEGYNVVFDYSAIRPEGSPLSSSSGKAPGHKSLERSLEKIRHILEMSMYQGERLRPIDAYDIVMHLSDAVLSGGVRRSATICLFSPDDKEMAMAKTGNWFMDNPQRGRSNNSALLLRGSTTREEFRTLMQYVREFGEPGFVWADSTELVVNPCVTSDTIIATSEGLRTVETLIDKQFIALVDGKEYKSSKKGFWKSGVKDVIELQFKSGRKLKLTQNHKLLTDNGWKESADITFEDNVVVNNHRNTNEFELDKQDYAKGYCLGNLLADGNMSSNTAEMKWWGEDKHVYRSDALALLKDANWNSLNHKENSESQSAFACLQSIELAKFAESKNCLMNKNKQLNYKALEGSKSYLVGLVAGYFDADGTVNVNHNKGCSLRITSNNLDNLINLQIILNYFGINSNIYNDRYPEGERLMPDSDGNLKSYFCKATHDLCISCDNIIQFQKVIPIRNKEKISKIETIISGYKRHPNKTYFFDKVVNKTLIGRLPVYDCTIEEVHAFDANGIYAHNCVEIGMYPVDITTMLTGWEACNLCEINGKKCRTEEDFLIACKAAAIIGTCQAGYTDLKYLGEVSKRILEREALLGVSITGMMDNPDILLNPELQRKMAQVILDVNEEIAHKIGINPCARATCVKPAGCLDENTKIKTSKGVFSLSEIFIDQGYSFSDIRKIEKEFLPINKPLQIFNENNELENVSKLYVNGLTKVYEIPLEDGTIVKATPWHKFKLSDGSWKRTDELKSGDDIVSF